MKWKCLRCDVIFDDSDKKCECETSPSPWVPLDDDLKEIPFEDYIDTKFTGYSYLDKTYEALETSLDTFQRGYRTIWWNTNEDREVALMYSICPYCSIAKEWTTTGLSPVSLECENCNKRFKI